MMRKTILVVVVSVFLAAANIASADLVQGIIIDFVDIGNPGNPADTAVMDDDTSGYGAVGYTYRIGKYEISNAQWYEFVTAAGVPTGNPSDAYDRSAYWNSDNIATNMVSWYEAAQFCNYLTSGDKSQGAYQFSVGRAGGDFLGIDRDSAVSTYGIVYVLPTEDEWHKAAYYTGSAYSRYANGTDTAPIAGDDTNYDVAVGGQPWDVGNGTQEQNGTYDMMGNVTEWNETLIAGSNRGLRGASYNNLVYSLRSSYRSSRNPVQERAYFGFRVASVPEPATLLLLGLGGLMLRKRSQA